MFEGIVRDGVATGMRFVANVYGFDVYTSNYLKLAPVAHIAGGFTAWVKADAFVEALPQK
jgi:hypothetical protein